MRRLFPVATFGMALVLSPLAWAQRDDNKQVTVDIDHARDGSQADSDYDSYPYDDRDFTYGRHYNEVQVLAHRVADSATSLMSLTETQSNGWDRDERMALEYLNRLQNTANRFHEMTESYSQGPDARDTTREFRRLVRAYAQAANAMDYLDARGNVYRAFRDVREGMDQLVRYYGDYKTYDYSYTGRGYGFRGPDVQLRLGSDGRLYIEGSR